MSRVETGNRDRLHFRSSSGVAGVVVGALIALLGWFVSTHPFEEFPMGATNVSACALVAAGVAAATIRFDTSIDRREKTLITSVGFLAPIFTRRRPLEVDRVHLFRAEYGHEGVPHISYWIAVVIAGRELRIGSAKDSVQAWALATELSEFLGADLQDDSSTAYDFQSDCSTRPLSSSSVAT